MKNKRKEYPYPTAQRTLPFQTCFLPSFTRGEPTRNEKRLLGNTSENFSKPTAAALRSTGPSTRVQEGLAVGFSGRRSLQDPSRGLHWMTEHVEIMQASAKDVKVRWVDGCGT